MQLPADRNLQSLLSVYYSISRFLNPWMNGRVGRKKAFMAMPKENALYTLFKSFKDHTHVEWSWLYQLEIMYKESMCNI